MAELVDALDLGSNALRRKGSSPFTLTKGKDFRFFERKSFSRFLKFFLKQIGFLNTDTFRCQNFRRDVSVHPKHPPPKYVRKYHRW